MSAKLSRMVSMIGALSVLLGAAGCNDGRDMEISHLRDKVAELEGRERDLLIRLKQAMEDLKRANGTINQLQGELAAARNMPQPIQQQAPQVPEGWKLDGNVAWTDIAENILFDSGKAELKATGRAKIQEVAQQIRSNFADLSIWVVGHTDSDPIKVSQWKDNLELSTARGRVVTLELLKLGLDPKMVVAGGQGEFNPKVSNDTRANKAVNRRVQIIAIPRPKTGGMAARPAEAQPAGQPNGNAGMQPVTMGE